MKELIKMWGAIIGFLVIIIIIWILAAHFSSKRLTPEEVILEKITQIENKIDSISIKKDSIRTIVVTIEKKIDKNNKNYEEVVNTIINSDDSTNLVWIEQYIQQYKEQLGK